ncbi:MAG: 4Fe-4S dicluster domain-containing protein [Dehalococcoidia bacterium]|nr:4Fe-4S dicluster domain-containing protein [Dehalococcoidia bacterium]
MSSTDPYAVLAERLNYPGSTRLDAILKYWLTPQQARICEALPGTPQDVSEKIELDEGVIRQDLEDLFVRGVVFPRGDYGHREYFRFARTEMQFHDASEATDAADIVKHRQFFELWRDFVDNEMGPKLAAHHAAATTSRGRVVPAYKSIKDLPGVLPYEDYRELVKAQRRVAVVRCSCRIRTTALEDHCEHCAEEERWNCLQFGRSADYSMARGAGKDLSADEALALIDRIEDDGLIHVWRNSSSTEGVTTSCNCCSDCCIDMVPLSRAGVPIEKIWAKSRYTAFMESIEACDGCQDCVPRCQFDAIEMAKVPGFKKLKAVIEEDKCYGCGACVVGCKPGALKMKTIRPVEHIPVLTGVSAE